MSVGEDGDVGTDATSLSNDAINATSQHKQAVDGSSLGDNRDAERPSQSINIATVSRSVDCG